MATRFRWRGRAGGWGCGDFNFLEWGRAISKEVGEYILPSGTFVLSKTPKKDQRDARIILFIFYMVFGTLLAFMLGRLFWYGRVEVLRTSYKVDVLETPSIAICPFRSGMKIRKPLDKKTWMQVFKVSTTGVEKIDVEPYICSFDRECICANLFHVEFHDYKSQDTNGISMEGRNNSQGAIGFHERIKVLTSLSDVSSQHTLKFGLFDSVDPIPMWFYVQEGAFCLGQLDLQLWLATGFTPSGVLATFRGDYYAMARQRHLYHYTSQTVGIDGVGVSPSGKRDYTTVSYEMRNFFVDETVSSETAYSGYTLAFILFLLILRSTVIDLFISTMFPIYTKKAIGPEVRELSWYATMFMNVFCCCLQRRKSSTSSMEDDGIEAPLLSSDGETRSEFATTP